MAELSGNIWEGIVSRRKGLFVKRSYCVITSDKIVFYKGRSSSSKIFAEINKSDIVDITLPPISSMEMFWKGYSGFSLKYSIEGNSARELKFFMSLPFFAAYPDKVKMQELGNALGKFYGKNEDSLATMDQASMDSAILGLFGLFGFLWSGLIGAILLAVAGHYALKINRDENIPESTRKIYAGLILLAGVIVPPILVSVLISAAY